MATKYAAHLTPKKPRTKTPQTKAIPGRENEMTANSAGGVVFKTGDFTQANRFLVLGAEGGTYYADEQTLTVKNAQALIRCIKADGRKLVDLIVDVSDGGKSYRNDACIFALALVFTHGQPDVRAYASEQLSKVIRIGTHMLTFVQYVDSMRGWGRGLREAVANWYLTMPTDKLAYQMIKYRQRNGWSHRDVLRLAHPKPANKIQESIFNFAADRNDWLEKHKPVNGDHRAVLERLAMADKLRTSEAVTPKEAVKMILDFDMPRETLRTELLNSIEVWDALLQKMPMTAMIRNLGKMSSIGLVAQGSEGAGRVIAALGNVNALKKARIHPIQILAAMKTYGQGHGMKGSLSWTPVQSVMDALDDAFYMAFDCVQPTGKPTLLALDVSGSMGGGNIASIPGLTPREASAALAMVTARTESNWAAFGFSTTFVPLRITPKQRLDAVVHAISGLPFQGTDCALPMIHAQKHRMGVDTFVVYTDNETWAGGIQPVEALRSYRQASGHDARVAVVGMTATGFTIADPTDPGMMDVVGLSTDTPQIIAEFARGNL